MGYYDLLGYGDYAMLGNVEITGEDDLDLLGQEESDLDLLGAIKRQRARQARGGRGGGMQAAAANRMAQQGALVQQVAPTKSRRLYLPINSGVVVAGAAANILVQPPQPVKVEEIKFDPVQAVNFQLTALSIGRQNQNMTAGAISCAIFSALNPGGSVIFDTAQTAEPINVAVVNVGGVNATLTGVFIVLTVE